MSEPIIVEPVSDEPILVEKLTSSAPSIIVIDTIPGLPGPVSMAKTCIAVVVDAGLVPLLPGDKADLPVPFTGVVTGWMALAFPAGNVTVDIQRAPFAAFPPGPADSITNGDLITLAGSSAGEGDAATWDAGLSEGDVLRYSIVTSDTIRRLTIGLFVERD